MFTLIGVSTLLSLREFAEVQKEETASAGELIADAVCMKRNLESDVAGKLPITWPRGIGNAADGSERC
jgi:hypothetical protein